MNAALPATSLPREALDLGDGPDASMLSQPDSRPWLDALPIGVLVVDAQGTLVDCNPEAEAQFGMRREQLLGTPAAVLPWQPVSAEGRLLSADQLPPLRTLRDGLPVQNALLLVQVADRPRRWLHASTRLSSSAGGACVVCSLVDSTERHAAEQALRAAAEQDQLTGLPNRAQMLARLQTHVTRARQQPGWPVSVLFLDFDRFKLVNDTMGHDAGDELLVTVAQRLREVLADGPYGDAFAARFGGDEFVITAAGLDTAAAEDLASRLIGVMAVPFVLKGNDFQSGVSIGVATLDNDTDGAQELMRNADIAMYEAKRAGRRTWVVFDQAMHARLARGMRIEAGLRLAVQRGELRLEYQPIVDLDTGCMTTVEALLRWDHPELGMVDPAEFIPIAEESGHIIEIGTWVLHQACAQWLRWQAQDPVAAPASVSVNLSRVQMAVGSHLVTVVHQAIEAGGMPPEALQLEITERELMRDPGAARELMLALASLGVRLILDDFGTGQSSLARLRDHVFHSVKIDRSFVTGLSLDHHMLAVAHATVNVIENLGMASIAEGIETPAELATLQALGCRFGQGRLFSGPLPPDRLLSLMARKVRSPSAVSSTAATPAP
jgi:diguanylate cyclase (GGDEF)-like protein/PAS domain S-box-containing protein